MSTTVLDILLCAQINFENIGKLGAVKHPIYLIAMNQLKTAIDALENGKNPNDVLYDEMTETGKKLMSKGKIDITDVLPGGLLASDYLHVKTNDGTCSRCRKEIRDNRQPSLILWVGRGENMYVFCAECVGWGE
jgi:hypothetical protein